MEIHPATHTALVASILLQSKGSHKPAAPSDVRFGESSSVITVTLKDGK